MPLLGREDPWRRVRLPTPVFLGCLLAQTEKNLPAMRESWLRYLGWEDPLEEDMATHSSIPAWRISLDGGAWRATVHGGHKELDTTERLSTALKIMCLTSLLQRSEEIIDL